MLLIKQKNVFDKSIEGRQDQFIKKIHVALGPVCETAIHPSMLKTFFLVFRFPRHFGIFRKLIQSGMNFVKFVIIII